MRAKIPLLALAAIVLLGAFFRFYRITEIPPGLYPDEAMNGNNALEALATGDFKIFYPENNGREGLFINLQAVSLWFFGNEPWALRVVSALFGTLTILGVYLAAKELFYGNPKHEIRNPKQYLNSNVQNPKPFRSFGFRILDLFRISNFEFRIYRAEIIALLSAFFTATSYWHINFSRIGFRAIMVPFFATFGLYFLLGGLRRGRMLDMVWAGIFIGLGFHTYIAFRFMPLVLAVPLVWYVWRYYQKKEAPRIPNTKYQIPNTNCAPCAIALFLFVTFVAALPVGVYFVQNPQDFFGRAGDVSILSAESPLFEFGKSALQTLGMFFWQGDCNWRHNYNCQAQLHPIVMLFFGAGLAAIIAQTLNPNAKIPVTNKIPSPNARSRFGHWSLSHWTLIGNWKFGFGTSLMWLFAMSLPATLTSEGLPHALRSIGMIPPAMILAAFGAWRVMARAGDWVEKQKGLWPKYQHQLGRIRGELGILFLLALVAVPLFTYGAYFIKWASHPGAYHAFSTNYVHIGQYLRALPPEVKKYVVVNAGGAEARGVHMPAQTVMFMTDTFREAKQKENNIVYVLTQEQVIPLNAGERTAITLLNGFDANWISLLKQKFPAYTARTPGDFLVFENY